MPRPLPPHIAWPLLVVGLLGMSFTAATYTVIAAYSDGGPQVVEGYYEAAEARHEAEARRATAEALGLRFAVASEPADATGLRTVVLTATDRTGAPVAGLRGTLTARRPHRAAPVATVPLQETEPGRYTMRVPEAGAGLWDFDVDAALGETPFLAVFRADLP